MPAVKSWVGKGSFSTEFFDNLRNGLNRGVFPNFPNFSNFYVPKFGNGQAPQGRELTMMVKIYRVLKEVSCALQVKAEPMCIKPSAGPGVDVRIFTGKSL